MLLKRHSNHSSPLPKKSDTEIENVRKRLTDLSIFISLLAGFPLIVFKIYQAIINGYDLSSWPTMVVYSTVSIFAFLRNSIDYRIRGAISIALLFLVTFFGLSHYGHLVACFIASLTSSILSFFILGKNNGMLFALFSSGMGMIIVFILGNQSLSAEMDAVDLAIMLSKWWPQVIAILAFYFSLALSIAVFESSLKKTIRQLEYQTKELKALNRDLIQSRDLAQRANEAKSEFMSVMSHELKTPLNPILGLLNLLREEPLNEESQEYVELMTNSSEHLLSMIEDILDFVEADQDKVAAKLLPIPIKEFTQSIAQIFRTEAEQKGLQFSSNYDFGDGTTEDIEILTEPKRLGQILNKLLVNAIKFTEKGSVELNLTRASSASGKCHLLFSIKDTGPGIPEGIQEHIFEPFVQGNGSDSRKYEGIGLGLNIALKNTKLLNGEISLESDGKTGSTFILKLPCLYTKHHRITNCKILHKQSITA